MLTRLRRPTVLLLGSAAIALLSTTCRFDPSSPSLGDATPPGGRDLTPLDLELDAEDAAVDGPVADAKRPPDRGADRLIADRSLPEVKPLPKPCTTTFGSVTGFKLCRETLTDCRFYAVLSNKSCASVCQSRGAQCTGSWDEGSNPDECKIGSATQCASTHSDHVCQCTRP